MKIRFYHQLASSGGILAQSRAAVAESTNGKIRPSVISVVAECFQQWEKLLFRR